MQLLGLLLLIVSSWYIWKLTDNFLDEQTKSSLSNEMKNFNGKLNEIKKIFSKEFLKEAWQKYKEEDGVLVNKKRD